MGLFSKLFGSDKPQQITLGRQQIGNASDIGDQIYQTAFGRNFYKPGSTEYDPRAVSSGGGMVDMAERASALDLGQIGSSTAGISDQWRKLIGDNSENFLGAFGAQRSLIQSKGARSLTGGLRSIAARSARSGFKSDGGSEAGYTRMNAESVNDMLSGLNINEGNARLGLFNSFGRKESALNELSSARREAMMRPFMARLQAIQMLPQFSANGGSYQNTGILNRVASTVGNIGSALSSFGGGVGAIAGTQSSITGPGGQVTTQRNGGAFSNFF